jgi:hypothetical protein
MSSPRSAILLALVALPWLAPSSAAACASKSCPQLVAVLPADDAAEVPRNIELRVEYSATPQGVHAVLETEDGQVVPTSWERAGPDFRHSMQLEQWIGRPTVPLAASTRYRLRHAYRECTSASDACGLCWADVGDVISEFMTAATLDEKTLAAPTLGAPVFTGFEAEQQSSLCGPYARCTYSVDVPALPAGQRLRVMQGDALIGYFGTERALVVGVHQPGSNGFPVDVDINRGGTFEVSVVDATGNRSPSTALVVPSCTGAPDADPVETADDGGCSTRVARVRWGTALWMALAMLVARLRRGALDRGHRRDS